MMTYSTTTNKAVNGEQPLTRSLVDYRPSIYVIYTAAITKLLAVQQLSTDISSYNVDIAAVTETHLKNKHSALGVLNDYALYKSTHSLTRTP